ncbi:MAG: fluoride efflux transporter CrcB [Burkholderiales bacterium]|nr:fluoride efflux transporter CrcB [Burkholderiales bacterium]
MPIAGFLAVGAGAVLGAWARWGLGSLLNALVPELPMGTLAANAIGGFLIGVAIQLFAEHPGIPPEARLFVITGFLGALTTFSTFSAEAVALLARAQWSWAVAHVGSHLASSLALTVLGMYAVRWLKG